MPKLSFADCDACPLKNAPVVASTIVPGASHTIVAESPGHTEVKSGVNLIGPAGDFLWKVLKRGGVTRDQCNLINVVACNPPYTSNKAEIVEAAATCCKGRVMHEMAQCGSTPTLVLGRAARQIIFPEEENVSPTTLHGRWQKIVLGPPTTSWSVPLVGGPKLLETKFTLDALPSVKAPVVVVHALSTLHPSYIISRNPNEARTFIDDVWKFTRGVQPNPEPPEIVIVNSLDQIRHFLHASEVSFDIETSQTDLLFDDILLLTISIAEEPNKSYIIPGGHPEAPSNVLFDTQTNPFWHQLWSSPTIKFVGHNALFDTRFLRWHLRWPVRCDFDTMLAHYVLDERKGTHDLKGVAARYLDQPDWEVTLHDHLASRNGDYGTIPWDVLVRYASYDSARTLQLRPILERQLCLHGLYSWPFMNEIMAMSQLFIEVEMHGMHVDEQVLEYELHALRAELRPLEEQFAVVSGGIVTNTRSPQQLATWFYDTLHLPTQTGKGVNPRSTDKLAIEKLAGKHPTVDLLRKIRRIQKMLSSYVENVITLLDHQGDVHADFKIHGTEISRIAVTSPALQTIPRSDDREEGQYGKRVKRFYIAHPGMKLGVVDYKQAELRVAAALSKDEYLIDAYQRNADIHVQNATMLYGPNFTKTEKNLTKMFVFSQLYGGNEFSFAGTAGIPLELARKMAQEMAKLMPRLNAFRFEIANEMVRKGFVQSRTGRRRRFPYVNDINKEEARKSALHSVVASGAASCTNLSAVRVNPKLVELGGHVLLLVHDSIIFEYPDDPAIEQQALKLVREEMLKTGESLIPEVPWRVTCEAGYSWGEVEEVEYDPTTQTFNIPQVAIMTGAETRFTVRG